ncbi:MAG: hypothetical protein ACP5ER_06640, partial [Candidatus Bathyarchaeales archaeon]
VIRKGIAFNSWRRRELADSFRWLFVDFVPLLYEKKRVARQFQVEMWLDLTQLLKELGIEKVEENKKETHPAMNYVV